MSRTLYCLATAITILMGFIALPLRIIPESWCYKIEGNLRLTNWVVNLFWWDWLHSIEMWAFEQSLRRDPNLRVWSNPNDPRYAFYSMLIEMDVE